MTKDRMEPLVFRKWTRKKWARFACVRRIVVIGVLNFSYNILAQEPPSHGTDTASQHLHIPEVEALGDLPDELDRISLEPLVILWQDDIGALPAQSPEEMLEYLPQVDVRNRGKHGTQADLNIQGGSFDQSLVLLNGINMSDPQTGHFHLNLPVDLFAVEKVSLFTGSAARHFGTNAFSGAINLTTRPADTTGVKAKIQFGQHNYYKSSLAANLNRRQLSVLGSFDRAGSEGYRENTDFSNTSAYLHASFDQERFRAGWMLGFNSREFGANSFYSPRFIHQFEKTRTGFTAVRMAFQRRRAFYELKGYIRYNQDDFMLDRYQPSFYRNNHMTSVFGVEMKGSFSSPVGFSRGALHLRRESILSTSLGEALEKTEVAGNVEYRFGHQRHQASLNLNHTLENGRFTMDGGMMILLHDGSGRMISFFPGIDLAYTILPTTKVVASVNRAMRLPTFTDLYYTGPDIEGNASLQPEYSTTIEMGCFLDTKKWEAGISGFYRRGRDMIDWIWQENEKWHALNLTRVDAMGGSLNLGFRPAGNPGAQIGLLKVDLSATFIHLNHVSEEWISRYLLDYLRKKSVMGIEMKLPLHFVLGGWITYQDRNGTYLEFAPATNRSFTRDYEPFVLVDLKLSWNTGDFTLFGEITNLTGIRYHDIGHVIQPGRWMKAGMAWKSR